MRIAELPSAPSLEWKLPADRDDDVTGDRPARGGKPRESPREKSALATRIRAISIPDVSQARE